MPTWDVRFDLHVSFEDADLVRTLALAEALAQMVRRIPMPPAVYDRIDRLNISRAIRGTTGIEGADLSEEEVSRVLSTERNVLGQARAREEQEARNAAAVMDFVARTLTDGPELPLTEDLVRELHRMTTVGIPYEHNEPGRYRSHSVSVGTYVPPRDREQVADLMRRFFEWLNGGPARAWPAVLRAIAAHFYFISIHPFGDGNGRTARAIESYLLYQAQINVVGFYSLSNFYYRNRPEYVAMLDFVRFESGGSLTPFLKFSVTGLVDELENVREEVLQAVTEIMFKDYVRSVLIVGLKGSSGGTRMAILVDHLATPMTSTQIQQESDLTLIYRDLSARTLTRDIQFLSKAGLIKRVGRMWQRNLDVMRQFTR